MITAQRSQLRAYRLGNHHRSFEWCHRCLPTTSTFPKMGVPWGPMPHDTRMAIYISATSDPMHFMFGSRAGLSGSAARMALFRVISNPRWRPAAILENFQWPYFHKGSCYIHFMLRFYGRVFRAPNYIARIPRSSLR